MSAPDALRTAVREGLDYALEGRLAPFYERHIVDECHYRTHEVLAAELAALAPPAGLFLDIGAGSGLVGRAILAHHLALQLVAIDISQAMLDLIEGPVYVAKHVADCTEGLPLANTSVDGALAAGLLEHIVDPSAIFGEVARVVRRGGIFLFSFPPNRAGQTELFDAEQGLLSHDVDHIRASLAKSAMKVEKEVEYPAYVNGSKGHACHRLVIASCGRG